MSSRAATCRWVSFRNVRISFSLAGGSSALSARAAGSILETAYCRNRAEREEAATAALDREVRGNLRLINSLSLCVNIAPMPEIGGNWCHSAELT